MTSVSHLEPVQVANPFANAPPVVQWFQTHVPGSYAYLKPYWVGLCTCTPYLAGQILDQFNGENRLIIPKQLAYLTKVMANGEWEVTGETIIFDVTDALRNGRHRLTASVNSGTTIKFFAIFGVSAKAFELMDQTSRRSFSQVLQMRGEKNGVALQGAITQMSNMIRHGKVGNYGERLTLNEITQILESYPDLRDGCKFFKSWKSWPSPAVGATLHTLFSCVSEKLCKEMFHGMSKLIMPEEPRWSGPRGLMVRFDQIGGGGRTRQGTKWQQDAIAALTIKAWNFFVQGLPCRTLKWSKEKEEFPTIYGWSYNGSGGLDKPKPIGGTDAKGRDEDDEG